jgi:hypothetical protein
VREKFGGSLKALPDLRQKGAGVVAVFENDAVDSRAQLAQGVLLVAKASASSAESTEIFERDGAESRGW